MPRIFLSHSSKDNTEATALRQWLIDQRPELVSEIFLDIAEDTGLAPGQRWKDALRQANLRCEAVICLVSHSWASSPECRTEYRTAETLGKQILVARLEDTGDSDITAEWQRCDLFAPGPKTEIAVADAPVFFNTAALDQLKKTIEGTGIGPENFVWPPRSDPERAPYRGWEPFEDIDAGVFFGRDAAIMRGTDELRKMRFSGVKSLFVVLGPSGSGKSSFLRAGLIPRLQRDDRNFVVMGTVRPGRNAVTGVHGLAAAIHSARRELKLPSAPPLGEIKKICQDGNHERLYELLVELCGAAGTRLAQATENTETAATTITKRQRSAPTLVLPLDQAEELFSSASVSAQAAAEAERFLELVAAVIRRLNTDEVRLIVAATIRTDRYEAMQNHPALDGIGTELFNELKTMPLHQFPAAIKGPAARASEAGSRLTIDDDLVERLISDAGKGADTLPLLALTMQRLHTDYGTDEQITLDHYESMGGMPNVVNNQIEEIVFAHPDGPDATLELLRSAFIPWLASINPDNDRALRRVALQSELPAESRSLIDAFVEQRLLVRDLRGSEVVLEVALESLLRQWDHLLHWLQDERQSLIAAADLERAAAAWNKHGRDESWLLQGSRLVTAETVAAKTGFAERLAAAADYLAASRQREDDKLEAEQRRHHDAVARRLVVHSKAILAQTIPGGDARAFQQLLAARALAIEPDEKAISEALALRARTLKIMEAGEPLLGVALRPDGLRLAAAGDNMNVWVWDAVTGQPVGDPVTGHTSRVHCVAYSPDGRRLVSAGGDKTVRVWDAETCQPIGEPLTGHTGVVYGVAFSPDGQRLASADDDRTVRVWDVATGRMVGKPLTGHTGVVYGVAFSPDGQRLASAGGDETVRLWDATSCQPVGKPLIGHTETVWAVAFSPDGKRLASGSRDQTVQLWDVASGQPLGGPLTGHTGVVCDVVFSPDGKRLASSSYDSTVRIWDLNAGYTSEALIGHTSAVHGVAFSLDGKRLASASQDNTARLWDADGDEPAGGTDPERLCAKLTSNMSREQWRGWVSPDIDYIPARADLPIPADHTARA
ncbi:MAG: TIR domain-containing protein [Mycobacterium sp.]